MAGKNLENFRKHFGKTLSIIHTYNLGLMRDDQGGRIDKMISEMQYITQQQANYIIAIKTYTVGSAGSDGCVTSCGSFVGGVGCGLGYNGVHK